MQDTHLPAKTRVKRGDQLARLGDPRPEVMEVDRMQFCFIPAGPLGMAGKVDLPAFWLGLHPVSNTQFDFFVKEEGYQHADWWEEAIKDKWWSKAGFKGRYDDNSRLAPVPVGDPFNLPNHPVVSVSWYEACAFTRWLEARWRKKDRLPKDCRVRLPLEKEWEKSARGGFQIPAAGNLLKKEITAIQNDIAPILSLVNNSKPDREYPWEGEFTPECANTNETGIGSTSALGCFPGGCGPYGNLDLSGNVWEWQENWYDKDTKSLRGGSWFHYQRLARCDARYGYFPDYGNFSIGFRISLSLPS